MALFLLLWAITFLLLKNAKLALYFSLALSFIAYISEVKQFANTVKDIASNYKKTLIIFIIFYFLYLYLSLVPMPADVLKNNFVFDPWAGGTTIVHSFRAANISLEAAINNIFPIMKQNVAQSALTEILLLLNIKGVLLQLITWIIFFLAAFFILICGFFQKFNFSQSRAIYATTILFFSAQGLSLIYQSMTDSGTTIFFIRNLDVLAGLGIFLVLLNETLKMSEAVYKKKMLFEKIACISALIFSLSLISSHIIILYITCFFFIVFLEKKIFQLLFPNKKVPSYNFKQNIILFIIILTAGNFSLKLFGFKTFLNVNILSLSDIPFLNVLNLNKQAKIFVWPNTAWYQNLAFDNYFIKTNKLFLPDFFHLGGWFEGFLAIKIIFFSLFFCLLGFLIFLVLVKSKFFLRTNNQITRFYLIGSSLFIVGFFISSFIDFGDSTRELTRFWLAGIFFGSFFLVYSSFYIFSYLPSNKTKYIVIKSFLFVVLVYTLMPSLLEITRWSYGNYNSDFVEGNLFGKNLMDEYSYKTLNLSSRLHFLLNYDNLFTGNN
jgi:hypothetical protein